MSLRPFTPSNKRVFYSWHDINFAVPMKAHELVIAEKRESDTTLYDGGSEKVDGTCPSCEISNKVIEPRIYRDHLYPHMK